MAPGTTQRVITLTAPNAESIAQCRAIIESMIVERMQQTGATTAALASSSTALGGGSSASSQMALLQKALNEGQKHITVQVPDADVGLIIGKQGAQIRTIQDTSGANVQIPQVADAGNPSVRTVNITCPTLEGAEFAKQMIEEVLASKAQVGGGGMGGGGGGGGDVTIQVNVSVLLICVFVF
jgi:far upstream element-binding protein